MRRWQKATAGAGVLVVGVAAYGTLDVYDVAPGVFTRASATPTPTATASPTPEATPVALPRAPSAPSDLPTLTGDGAPVPAKVAAMVAPALKDKDLTHQVALTVRDAATGKHLVDRHSDQALTPASITKLLSAWAIANTMNLSKPLTTKVVSGPKNHVVLVAGGDTVLNPGKGDPDAVSGHAGVADLAAQVAQRLKKSGRTEVTVDYDATYAPGPLTAPGWKKDFLRWGYTARIAQMGLSTQRSDPPTPAVKSPDEQVQRVLVEQLTKRGITAHRGDKVTAAKDADRLGAVQSAPLIDVLGLALEDSDNAMIESLTRQAAYLSGVPGRSAAVTDWVVSTLRQAGFDMSGVHLADTCGLSDGTTIPARVLADLIMSGVSGHNKPFQRVLSRLPVGGWNGTLHDRFLQTTNDSAAGLVRAKTGSLPKVSSLAGTVVDKDGRLLVFTIITNGKQPTGPWATRAAIDDVIARLARCGCTAGHS